MKTTIHLLFLTLFITFATGCQKTDIKPASDSQEVFTNEQFMAADCPAYFYYMGSQPRDLGPLLTDKVIIGFKKGTNQVNKNMVLSAFPQLVSIAEETQTNAADLTMVWLVQGLTCADMDILLNDLPLNPHIDFAGGYFNYPGFPGARIGITNAFIVSLNQGYTIADVNNLLKQTKTEISEDLGFGTYVIRITKQSPQNSLATANQFYESGLFLASEPDFYFEFPPME